MGEVIYVEEELSAGTGGQGKEIQNTSGDGGGLKKCGTGRSGYGRGVQGLKRAGGQKEIDGVEQEARYDVKIMRHSVAATEVFRRQKFLSDSLTM